MAHQAHRLHRQPAALPALDRTGEPVCCARSSSTASPTSIPSAPSPSAHDRLCCCAALSHDAVLAAPGRRVRGARPRPGGALARDRHRARAHPPTSPIPRPSTSRRDTRPLPRRRARARQAACCSIRATGEWPTTSTRFWTAMPRIIGDGTGRVVLWLNAVGSGARHGRGRARSAVAAVHPGTARADSTSWRACW